MRKPYAPHIRNATRCDATRRHQPSAISHQPSAISHQTSDIRHQPSDISHACVERIGPAVGNDENTELYAVHPFQLLSVNRTALSANKSSGGLTVLGVNEGRETYFRRRYPKNLGETADIMQAARLGARNMDASVFCDAIF